MRVVVTRMFVDLDRRGTTGRNFAVDTLELNCGVVNAKLLPQRSVDLLQDECALGRRDVGNLDVRGQRMRLRAQTPDVQVVDVLNPVDGLQRNAYLRQRTTSRRSL